MATKTVSRRGFLIAAGAGLASVGIGATAGSTTESEIEPKPHSHDETLGVGAAAFVLPESSDQILLDHLAAEGFVENEEWSRLGVLFAPTATGDWDETMSGFATFVHSDGREAIVSAVVEPKSDPAYRPIEAHVWSYADPDESSMTVLRVEDGVVVG